MILDQNWFEFRDVRRRKLDTAVWIPLRAVQTLRQIGRRGYAGCVEEFHGVGSLAVFSSERESAEKLGWMDVGISHTHSGWCQDGRYTPADHYETFEGNLIGIHLVLEQEGNSDEVNQWHLHQDLAITFGLKREGDVWVAPNEGYLETARLRRRESGKPCLLEFRAEYLKDYLCARSMALYVTSYRSRRETVEEAEHIDWKENPLCETEGGDRWEGRILEIHEGGEPYGHSVAVFHVSRTNVDPEEDVPVHDVPGGGDVASRSWTRTFEGRKLYTVQGELWRNEWVEPALHSPRIRWDKLPSTVSFIVTASGEMASAEALKDAGRWLWFRPEVIMALSHRRGGQLSWYTRDTGNVTCSPSSGVHFGMNRLGLINAYAKDIALLPEWQQRIWVGYNVTPDGGVSEELLASQMKADPSETQAPEKFLPVAIERLNQTSNRAYTISVFRGHDQSNEIYSATHRFRAIDQPGLYSLAKDLARLTVDSINATEIYSRIGLQPKAKLGSLKSLEQLVSRHATPEEAHRLMSPLFYIYDLRQADAHLPSSAADKTLDLIGVNRDDPTVLQGYVLLHACVSCLWNLGTALQRPANC